MPRYKELDTLRSFTAKLNTAISNLSQPVAFADLLVQNKLIGEPAARNITSPTGTPDYNKVSRLMSAVYSYVQTVASQEKATEIFNKLVCILHNDLKLTDLAEQLIKHRGEEDPTYISPLLSSTVPDSTCTTDQPSGASATPSTPTDIMQEEPSLNQLTLLKNAAKTKKVEIIKSVAAKWKEFGTLLDFDKTGTYLDNLEVQYAGKNPVDHCRAMFQYWLQGNGKVKATWENLLELLEDSGMSVLAGDIKQILES